MKDYISNQLPQVVGITSANLNNGLIQSWLLDMGQSYDIRLDESGNPYKLLITPLDDMGNEEKLVVAPIGYYVMVSPHEIGAVVIHQKELNWLSGQGKVEIVHLGL